jgi:hypothetical protein
MEFQIQSDRKWFHKSVVCQTFRPIQTAIIQIEIVYRLGAWPLTCAFRLRPIFTCAAFLFCLLFAKYCFRWNVGRIIEMMKFMHSPPVAVEAFAIQLYTHLAPRPETSDKFADGPLRNGIPSGLNSSQ